MLKCYDYGNKTSRKWHKARDRQHAVKLGRIAGRGERHVANDMSLNQIMSFMQLRRAISHIGNRIKLPRGERNGG